MLFRKKHKKYRVTAYRPKLKKYITYFTNKFVEPIYDKHIVEIVDTSTHVVLFSDS